MADDFHELYKHPNWQRKRLEVMEAAGFRCQHCGDTGTTLNVHHRYYIKGNKPWEYDDRVFVCICEPCHEKTTALLTKLKMCGGLLSATNLGVLVSIASVMLSAEQPYGELLAKLQTENAELRKAAGVVPVEASSDF